MTLLITLASILAITGTAWLANRTLGFRICPICAGVAGTWIWILVGVLTDILPISTFQLPASILMGGSVVGIAYQLEKRLPLARASANKLLLWKILFIPAGFTVVFLTLTRAWGSAVIALAALGSILFWLVGRKRKQSPQSAQTVTELEEKMKQCC